ncbi:hypothetical protein E5676_scaffold374G00450 [Cucumis melo var. makuwa]|uniref:Uncharacterized protein n=1 Tax=Cucumis melo var. makuwa TaxID=1194695 RepID=A0A5D3BVF9_CUCMM|nr:hypothetical protein E5676_scaffold374G00450 [Cucumis melo var. makuwa]
MNPSYWRYDMVKSRPSSLRSFRVKAVQDTGGPRSRPKVTFPIAVLNNFKMGFTYGLFVDAFKLAS